MIPYSCQSINEDDIEAVVEALKSSHLTQGKRVLEFEEALCEYVGVKHAITFNSATSALHSAYIAAEIGEDDEVITTPISFVATSNMFVELGAKPVWCDVKLDGNIDERFIERLVTSKTKAIVPVDYAGKSVEMESILEIASKHNLMVIDDASHALGSEFNGKKVGSMADMSIFSFHAIKPITTAEGGAVVTNSDELAKRLRKIRSHGVVKKTLWNSDMDSMGYNYRLSDVAAALGISQLQRLDSFIEKRDKIAKIYDEAFKNSKLFTVVQKKPNIKSSHHLYIILLNPTLHCPKEDIFKELQAQGMGVQVHYKPIYQNSFYKKNFGEIALHVANDFYKSEISLPCHQGMSLDDAKEVAKKVLHVMQKYSYRGCSF